MTTLDAKDWAIQKIDGNVWAVKLTQPAPKFEGKPKKDGTGTVTYPAGERYNGGIVVRLGKSGQLEWVQGFKIPRPIIPDGFALHNLGCSYKLNECPPYATNLLVREKS